MEVMPAQDYRAHAEELTKQANLKAALGNFKDAIEVAPVGRMWAYLYKVQSENDRPIPAIDISAIEAMPAQEYRTKAEDMAKSASLKANLGASDPANAAAIVGHVWTYLYKIQLANDRLPPASMEAMSAQEYRLKAEEMAKQATLKSTLGAVAPARACAMAAQTWAYLYSVQSKYDRSLANSPEALLEAMSAQEYRAKAEEMAKQAELKASLASAQPATAAALVAQVWTYLYRVQSRNDRPTLPLD